MSKIVLEEQATADTPATNKVSIYPKAGGELYRLNDAGDESQFAVVGSIEAHKTSHQNDGSDEISVAGLSGLLADDQHVLDTEVLAVAAAKGANTDITSLINAALAVGRDADNKIDFGTDDHLKIKIAGTESDIVSISTGTSDNDKLVTQGYVDDNGGSGSGDVIGPATNSDEYIPQWDGADSKTLKNGFAKTALALSGANTDITSLTNAALAVGRDSDNKIDFGTDDHLKIKIAGTESDIVSVSTGTADNDKLVTQGYVDDNLGGKIANLSEDTTPALGGPLELNEKTILVDAVLGTDATWTGPTQVITAGEELTIGEVAYLKSDGKYWLADADAEATADTKLVMATATIAADATGLVLLPSALSFMRVDATTEWTVTGAGDVMFLSLTAGELTNDVSAYTTLDIVRICGYMETATILNFDVDKTYIEVA